MALIRTAAMRLAYLIVLLVLTATAARAETVGVIITHNETFYEKSHKSLLSELERAGYKQRFKFIVQRPHADPIAWSNASRKLIAADVDFIVTYGAPATLSAIKERSDIPIVYSGVYEPVAKEIEWKLATGVCSKYPVTSLLRHMKIASSGRKIGIVYSRLEEDSAYQHAELSALSGKYDLEVVSLNLRNPLDIASMLSDLEINSLLVTSSSMVRSVLPTIMRIANSRKIPVASLLYEEDDIQPVIMLSSNPEENGKETAKLLMRLLDGTTMAEVKASCTQKIVLVFNAREARGLGIRIPMDLVTEATRIIY